MAINLTRPVIKYVSFEELDSAMATMLSNDSRLMPDESQSPNIWKCKWYNIANPTSYQKQALYYQLGDAVWLNTEDLNTFVDMNYDYIEAAILDNAALRYKYEAVKDDEDAVFELFKKIATGEITGNQDGLPLFYIGDLSCKARVRVSLSANNNRLPTDDQYWKDLFIDNESMTALSILSCADTLCEQYMDAHLKEYHLSGIENALGDSNNQVTADIDDICLHNTLSNLTGEQRYSGTNDLAVSKGFDWVIKYFHKQFNSGRTCKWFRVWNSGLVEQGGIVIADSSCAENMSDSLIYPDGDENPTCYKVCLGWKSDGITAPIFQYSTSGSGFYSHDTQFDLGDGNNIQITSVGKTVSDQNRYTVSLTPMYDAAIPYSIMRPQTNSTNGYYYATREILDMKNDSFGFILTPGCNVYSYYVTGFVSNSQQAYK